MLTLCLKINNDMLIEKRQKEDKKATKSHTLKDDGMKHPPGYDLGLNASDTGRPTFVNLTRVLYRGV